MRIRKAKRKEWQLSFASMSDIAFLLMIFFVVAGKFTKDIEQKVVLPTVDLGERSTPREIRVVVDKFGQYFVNDSKTEKDALEEEIGSFVLSDMTRDQRTVRMYVDKDAEYGAVFAAIEACNRADVYLELAVLYGD